MQKQDKNQSKKEKQKQEKQKQEKERQETRESEKEQELKIIREIKPGLREIESEETEEQEQELEQDSEEFLPETSTTGEITPVLKKTNLEQAIEGVDLPEDDKEKKEKEEEGAIKYFKQDSKYFTGEEEPDEEKEKSEPLMKLERAPMERLGHRHIDKNLGVRERPVHFVDDMSHERNMEEVIKYEKAEPEKTGADLPFSPKSQANEIEKRVKKYKKRL